MKSTFSKSLSQAALVAALAISAGFAAAQAQPGMSGAAVGPLSQGHSAHGMDAKRTRGDFGRRLEAIKAQLNLNATQEAQFNVAKAASVKAMEAGKAARMNAAKTVKSELAKADPDLALLLTTREAVREAAQAERKAATAEWAKFLSTLNAEQKAVVKSQLLDRMHRAEAMREKFSQQKLG
jgi:LTXXQ motif family protein